MGGGIAHVQSNVPPSVPAQQAGGGEPAPRRSGLDKVRISPGLGNILVMLGVLFIFVGIMVSSTAALLEEPDHNDYDYDEQKKYQRDYDAYEEEYKQTLVSGRQISWLGTMLITLTMMFMGLANADMKWQIRAVRPVSGLRPCET